MKDALGAVQSVLVLGGGSEIGVAIAAKLATPRQATVVLAARNPGSLAAAVGVVEAAGASRVETVAFDADDTDSHEAFVADVAARVGDLDVVVLAFGLLGDQAADAGGADGGAGAVAVARTNYLGAVSVGLAVARLLRRQGHGTLVVLSSVAGERVRRANYIYGSSKAGLDGFAQGLGDDLVGSGAAVLIVRPGFVRGRMTAGMDAAPLSTTPAAVADATAEALAARKEMIWVPGALRVVFAVFRHLPGPLATTPGVTIPGVTTPGATTEVPVAAFDFDGTLVPGDSLRPFLALLLGRRHLVGALAEALPGMALAYRRGGRDAAKVVLLHHAVAGLEATVVDETGRAFGRRLAHRIRPDVAARLVWHRERGHRMVLVSASLTNYLEPFGRHVGFDDVIATRLAVRPDGRLTGDLAGPNVRGPERSTGSMRCSEGSPASLWAYGDSAGDRELLAAADHPTLVRRRPVPPA